MDAIDVGGMSSSDAACTNDQLEWLSSIPPVQAQTNDCGGTVSSLSLRRAEGSMIEGACEGPRASGENSSTGTEAQPQHDKEKHSNQKDVSCFPSLFDEIRFLQDRLLHIEGQAAQQWKATVEDAPPEDSEGGDEAKGSDPGDDKVLRRHIRKAPSGRWSVERFEQQAEEAAEARKDYGQAPNKLGPGIAKTSMYHITEDGSLLKGDEVDAVAKQQEWLMDNGYWPGIVDDINNRSIVKPFPHRGVRPRTAMHPFHETTSRRDRYKQERRTKSSRKLGPPTRWDESNSEEWSSDTSTGSQDFRYFRARLRGDFEWELDRLNAQVMRYKTHQNKKKSRQLAIQAEQDKEKDAFGGNEQDGAIIANLRLADVGAGNDGHGVRQLNPLRWSDFRQRRALPLEYSFVIDVLMEEPKLSSDLKPWLRRKKDKEAIKEDANLRAPAAKDSGSKDDTLHGVKQSPSWKPLDPLPERIRINSKQIIDILSSIHGSRLCPDADQPSSVVLLRPFKILQAYDKEIRESCSRLEDGGTKEPQRLGIVPEEEAKNQTIEKPSDADEKQSAEEQKASPISQDEQRLQMEHLKCLREFMDEYIGRKVTHLSGVTCVKICFSDVWHLFQPGTIVISADGKQAYRVVSLNSKQHKGVDRWDAFWTRQNKKKRRASGSSDESGHDTRSEITIRCVFIHFDGESFGPVVKNFHINKWDGEKEVTYLDIYPIRFHVLKHLDKRSAMSTTKVLASMREQEVEEGVQALRRKLVSRGRVFLDVAAVKQMYYSGLAVDTRDEIESQVMVDFEEALAHEKRRHWIPNITKLVGADWSSRTDEADEGCAAECCWRENVHDDAYVETSNNERFIDDMMAEIKDTPHKLPSAIIFPRSLEETKTESNALTDDELMIMSYSVFGFVLRDRTWAKLDLDCMSPVRAPGNATEDMDDDLEEGGQGTFGQLVLPKGHKKMVLSLISQHFRNKGAQDSNDEQLDIVRGKGKGLIILLHGAPGVGKTTTAEGVAETFGQPLFQITCGDLGSNPKDVEAALQTNFALANRWGCILLLDEADVFLAERRRTDFNRNGLVAVFLRVMEYYAGILFLTTNRIGDFDEAFASRIHMSLHYPALDEVSTAKVFRLNLGLIKARLQERVKIQEDEIITEAQKHWREHKDARWNGRQIRNACQTALALAEFDAQPKGKKYDIKEKSTTRIHLKLSHLEIVSKAYLEFTDYLKAVHGADADGRAKEDGIRTVEAILEAIKLDRKVDDAGVHRSHSRGSGQTGRETPLQSFRLQSGGSAQRPTHGMAAPSSPEPGTHHTPVNQGMHSTQRLAHEPPSVPAQRMQYNQSPYAGSQSFMGDMRSGMHPPSQQVQPGTYLQPHQSYSSVGHGGRGQYQASDQYMHENQPLPGHDVSYPSPPTSAVSGGPASGGPSLGRFGDDQSRQGHRGGQGPYDDSEQM